MNLNVNSNLTPNHEEMYEARNTYPSLFLLMNDIVRTTEHNASDHDDSESALSKTAKTILMQLNKKDGVTQLDIAHSAYLKAPTISLAMQKLEKDGYVIRKPDNYDLRSIRVFLTEKGRDFNNSYIARILEEEKKGLAGINENDIKHLLKILRTINENLSEKSEI